MGNSHSSTTTTTPTNPDTPTVCKMGKPTRASTAPKMTSRKRGPSEPELPSNSAPASKRRKVNGTTQASSKAYDLPSDDHLALGNPETATKPTGIVVSKRQSLPAITKQPRQGSSKATKVTQSAKSLPVSGSKASSKKAAATNGYESPEPQDDYESAANESPSKGRGHTPKDQASNKKLVAVGNARKVRSSLTPSEPLKGILTPRKNKGPGRPRKSVLFDDSSIETSTTKEKRGLGRPSLQKQATAPKKVEAPAAPVDDDDPCAICGKPDTTPRNDILFCDKCDVAVHQKCYGVATVPKGDWFCRKCSGEPEPQSEPKLEPEPEPPVKRKPGRPPGSKNKPKGLPGSTNKPKAKPGPKPKQSKVEEKQKAEVGKEDEEEDKEEDVPCAICGNPNTEADDDIIFCDNCEYAVHQKCYNVLEIPEGDWLCRRCAKKEVPPPEAAVKDHQELVISPAPIVSSAVPDIPNFDLHLRSLQRVLLDRCTGRRMINIRDQDDVYQKAHNVISQTVLAGEGNSMLLIGARGCGKTTLVESIIGSLRTEHEDDFHVVRLSGFVHTDDKLALKEIWRQLAKDRGVEQSEASKGTYADTMASLLALLSTSEEITGEETEEGTAAKSVIFIIDEFDLFAAHGRQTLLYNLFDIAQAKKAPIAVLGLTTRIEVVELLEKRVKSRFSHRSVYLSMPKTLPIFWDICRQGLLVDEGDMEGEGIDINLEGHDKFYQYWGKKIEHLRKNETFDHHLKYHYYGTKSVPSFLKTCILPLAHLSATDPTLVVPADIIAVPAASTGTTEDVLITPSLEAPDSKLHLLASLADLDLALLVSAARLDIVADTDTVNFAMAYDEYTSLMSKQRVASAASGLIAQSGSARVWGRNIASAAWERLISLGLLVASGIGGGGLGARGAAGLGSLENKMWKVDVRLEEIPGVVDLNTMLARWCREI